MEGGQTGRKWRVREIGSRNTIQSCLLLPGQISLCRFYTENLWAMLTSDSRKCKYNQSANEIFTVRRFKLIWSFVWAIAQIWATIQKKWLHHISQMSDFKLEIHIFINDSIQVCKYTVTGDKYQYWKSNYLMLNRILALICSSDAGFCVFSHQNKWFFLTLSLKITYF